MSTKHRDHDTFITALHGLRTVEVHFIKKTTGEHVVRECWPLDFGPYGDSYEDHYSLMNLRGETGMHPMGLLRPSITKIVQLASRFDPSDVRQIIPPSHGFHISRAWW